MTGYRERFLLGEVSGEQEVRQSLLRKRLFDVVICVVVAPVWLPVLAACMLAILVLDGRPVFYVSNRRLDWRCRPVWKFRCMVRDAERLANRDTIPVTDQRFLNIPADSPLYSPVGRVIEKLCLTELPQLFQVLAGSMTLVGNRPLPENVIASLREAYPQVEDRFVLRGGMTGPVQLVGRTRLDDGERLDLEIEYCRLALHRWTPWLDLAILFYTVLIGLRLRQPLTVAEVRAMMRRLSRRQRQVALLAPFFRLLLPERRRSLDRRTVVTIPTMVAGGSDRRQFQGERRRAAIFLARYGHG